MYNAPPVVFPVGRFLWGRVAWLGTVLVLVSAGGLWAWSHLAQISTEQSIAAWSLWCICGVGAAVGGSRQTLSDGRLFWNGQTWSWLPQSGQERSLQLTVGLDLGDGLLLFLRLDKGSGQGFGHRVCVWVSKAAMPSNWHGFRCAVYSRPKASATLDEPQT